jgi:hypothetical protein
MVEDRVTGLASLFNVLERIVLQRQPMPTPVVPPGMTMGPLIQLPPGLECVVLSVWMSEPGDSEHEYTHQFTITTPDGNTFFNGELSPFRFGEGCKLQRFRLNAAIGLSPETSGLISFESRIKTQDGAWLSQDYPLQLEIITSGDQQPTHVS